MIKKFLFRFFASKITSTVIVVTFLKMYRYRYRRYFFSKVSVPISSLLLKYRVPTSELPTMNITAKANEHYG